MYRNLGSDVVGCATERSRGPVRRHSFLTHTEVSQLYVSLTIQQNVVQLQISSTQYTDPELHAGPNFKIRPDPAHENRDPTRPDDYP